MHLDLLKEALLVEAKREGLKEGQQSASAMHGYAGKIPRKTLRLLM